MTVVTLPKPIFKMVPKMIRVAMLERPGVFLP